MTQPKPFRIKVRFLVEKEIDLTLDEAVDYFVSREDFGPIYPSDILALVRDNHNDDSEITIDDADIGNAHNITIIEANFDDLNALNAKLNEIENEAIEEADETVEEPKRYGP